MTPRILAAALATCLAVVPLGAHHAYPGFELTPTVFEGRVESITIANPHTLIELTAADARRYRIIFLAVSALRRAFVNGAEGMTSRIHVGDTLLVSGRLKRGDELIEVCSAQFDDAHGVPIYPLNRPAITRLQGSGLTPASFSR